MNGKGTLYFSDGNIIYDGEWLDDKYEGNGKLFNINGEYYIGQFKNGLKHGKGKEYDKNGNIIYDGEFINDKKIGNVI